MDITATTARTALVVDRKLVEVLIDNSANKTAIGDIYVGKVENIFNQFAFVNIGGSKKAFLSLNDIRERIIYEEINGERKLNLKIGQQLLVQVLKDSSGEKGANVTTELSFSGRYVVLIKIKSDEKGTVFISKKIESGEERGRLSDLALGLLPEGYNMIMRTSCFMVSEDNIREEIKNLIDISGSVISKSAYIKPPVVIYSESDIYTNSLKSFLKEDIDNIIVNSSHEFENIKDLVESYFRNDGPEVKLYEGSLNIFDEYEVELQIEKALSKKVWLKSGGFIIIEETEACVVIDVNTGKLTSKKNKDSIIFKNNMEAATEIIKQLRLRNLSGIIIIDFIDMDNENDKENLMAHLQDKIKEDRIAINIVGMTSLGLVQLTRKKTRKPLSKYLLNECSACQGTGFTYSDEHIVDKIYREVCKILKQTIFNSITVNLNSKIHHKILVRKEDFEELEKEFDAKIKFKKLSMAKLDYFDIEKEKI